RPKSVLDSRLLSRSGNPNEEVMTTSPSCYKAPFHAPNLISFSRCNMWVFSRPEPRRLAPGHSFSALLSSSVAPKPLSRCLAVCLVPPRRAFETKGRDFSIIATLSKGHRSSSVYYGAIPPSHLLPELEIRR
ncbi:UNVERIFIED_CONTAM: hypothetical protein K2H54_012070, partial [Gekko kuhli]